MIFRFTYLVSTYVVCERLSVMHKQVSVHTVNFWPNSPEHPPPSENWNLGRSWHFEYLTSEYPPPTPENGNLGRSWHFEYLTSEYPPPPQKLKFRQILALWVFDFRIPPPPPPTYACGSFCMWRLIFIIRIIF